MVWLNRRQERHLWCWKGYRYFPHLFLYLISMYHILRLHSFFISILLYRFSRTLRIGMWNRAAIGAERTIAPWWRGHVEVSDHDTEKPERFFFVIVPSFEPVISLVLWLWDLVKSVDVKTALTQRALNLMLQVYSLMFVTVIDLTQRSFRMSRKTGCSHINQWAHPLGNRRRCLRFTLAQSRVGFGKFLV